MSGDAWQRELRARGYRLTPQRQLVLEAVERLGHATPEEIAGEVKRTAHGVNLSTIYRSLELLEDLGLVTHAHFGHGPLTYHAKGGDEHAHLVCQSCERIVELPPAALTDVIERLHDEYGFAVDVTHMALSGLCADCAARTESG
jgi:Fur family transcriptional regulator, ferric uptake regulator